MYTFLRPYSAIIYIKDQLYHLIFNSPWKPSYRIVEKLSPVNFVLNIKCLAKYELLMQSNSGLPILMLYGISIVR